MPGACRLRQFWRFNLILTIVGAWGVPLARYPTYLLEARHKLRLYRVMIGHATLWLYEACSGTLLGA